MNLFNFTAIPIVILGGVRYVCHRLALSFDYINNKDNISFFSKNQLYRESRNYSDTFILHTAVLCFLGIIDNNLLFNKNISIINTFISFLLTLFTHIVIVEPIYYFTHLLLHQQYFYKYFHSFHHSSIITLPTTGIVQNITEHIVYVIIFSPAILIPYIYFNMQNFYSISIYIILFDLANMLGHSNIKYTESVYKNTIIKYMFYSPEFHACHHRKYKKNFSLFMPIWDHLFGTYEEYSLPMKNQFVNKFNFIVHLSSFNHLLTIPELNFYAIYDKYDFSYFLDVYILSYMLCIMRLFINKYSLPKYIINNSFSGCISSVIYSPYDYFNSNKYNSINNAIFDIIKNGYINNKCCYFGLGNLNKSKALNDNGNIIVDKIENDPITKGKVKIFTGDTMTAASIFYKLLEYNVDKIFYIGGTGKIGCAVVQLLIKQGIKVCLYTKSITRAQYIHKLVDYSDKLIWSNDLSILDEYNYVIIGKMIDLNIFSNITTEKIVFDYNVPFRLINSKNIIHKQIGIFEVTNRDILHGYYNISCGIDDNHIFSCHLGCIINLILRENDHETGEIDINKIEKKFEVSKKLGFINIDI